MTWLSVAATAAPAQAQGSADPNPGFRAIFQDDTGVAMWPYGDLGSRVGDRPWLSGGETFEFLSVAGVVTVPFTSAPTRFGSWNIHGGVEFLMLGDRNEAVFGDSSHVIGSIGIGLSY